MEKVNQLKLRDTVKVVERKEDGQVRVVEVHYGDGRQAAAVRPDVVRFKVRRDG